MGVDLYTGSTYTPENTVVAGPKNSFLIILNFFGFTKRSDAKLKTSGSFFKEVNRIFTKTELSKIVCFMSHLILPKLAFTCFGVLK